MHLPPPTPRVVAILAALAERTGLVTTTLEHAPGEFPVVHLPSRRCAIEHPHDAADCGEFDPPRPGFAPDPDPPLSGVPLRTWGAREWAGVWRRLEQHATAAAADTPPPRPAPTPAPDPFAPPLTAIFKQALDTRGKGR